MSANYFILILSARPAPMREHPRAGGSVVAPPPPFPKRYNAPKTYQGNYKGNKTDLAPRRPRLLLHYSTCSPTPLAPPLLQLLHYSTCSPTPLAPPLLHLLPHSACSSTTPLAPLLHQLPHSACSSTTPLAPPLRLLLHCSTCSSTPSPSASYALSFPSPSVSPSDPSLSQFPPPVEPSPQHGCYARSLRPPGCTYHPPAGRPRATSASLLRLLLDPRPHRCQLSFPLVPVLEEVVSRLMSTTIVFRVAPPAVVVRSVIRALQVHAREGMPGLGLVEPRGRSLLRPGWGRVGLVFLPGDVPIVEPSPLAPRPGFRPLLFRMPCASDALEKLAVRVAGRRWQVSATQPRRHPARWRPAWPTRPRSRSRGSLCARGASGSRSRQKAPAAIAFLTGS